MSPSQPAAPATPPRFVRPDWFTSHVFNPFIGWLVRRGVDIAGAAILEVTGRKSGEPRRTPVNPLNLRGDRYLVAPRGETEWVRNIRVTGVGALIRGSKRHVVEVVEVPDGDKLPVIRAYLQAWGWEVGMFFEGLSAKSSDDEVRAVAPGFPVFRILPEQAQA